MTRRLRAGLAAALVGLAGLAAGCGTPATPPAASSGLDRILGQHTVRVCSTGDYRPFSYVHDGSWSGLDIDMAGDLARRLHARLALVRSTFAALTHDVGTRCDLAMGGISVTLDRAAHAVYSIPYVRDGKAAIVRCADAGRFHGLADLDQPGVRVVVNPGGTNASYDAQTLHRATIVRYPDNNTIFGEITANRADAMITDASEVRWQTRQNPALCGVSTANPFTFEEKAYLMPRGDNALQQWVNQWLHLAQNDGTYAAINRKWLG